MGKTPAVGPDRAEKGHQIQHPSNELFGHGLPRLGAILGETVLSEAKRRGVVGRWEVIVLMRKRT